MMSLPIQCDKFYIMWNIVTVSQIMMLVSFNWSSQCVSIKIQDTSDQSFLHNTVLLPQLSTKVSPLSLQSLLNLNPQRKKKSMSPRFSARKSWYHLKKPFVRITTEQIFRLLLVGHVDIQRKKSLKINDATLR